MTTAIISFTDDHKYDFSIPIVKWCWEKLNVSCHFLIPDRIKTSKRFKLIESYCNFSCFSYFKCPIDKEITYAQVGRLFMGNQYDDEDVLITSDADMLVFEIPPYFGTISIYGHDLVPNNQYPMCYATGKALDWKKYFGNKPYQQQLDDLLGSIECENMRGNYWAADQEHLFNKTSGGALCANRAATGTQFAVRRIDRDDIGWRNHNNSYLFDAHLWRPGYTDENFANIMELLTTQYPRDNFQWLLDYRQNYISLL